MSEVRVELGGFQGEPMWLGRAQAYPEGMSSIDRAAGAVLGLTQPAPMSESEPKGVT